MKKIVLAGAMLALMAVAAEAQVTLEYQRKTRNSTLTLTYSSGYYGTYGYGGFGGYGFGYGGFYGGYPGGAFTYYAAGLGVPLNGMPMSAPYPLYPPAGSFYSGYGLYSYGTPAGLYGGRAYRSPYRISPVGDYTPRPGPAPLAAGRMDELASAKEIEVGRLRFKGGDYKGALNEFRSAVVADTTSGVAQAYFAVGLVVTGDHKNADKALRAAADRAPLGRKVDLTAHLASEKERARLMTMLGKVAGDGALAAAYALSVMGDAEPLKKLSEKDPAAKKLLP